MLIGLVIIGALVTLFVNTSGNNRELARANSMIENGRFAIKVLEDDLAHAGYWGAYVPAVSTTRPRTPFPRDDPPRRFPTPACLYSPTNWNAAYKTNLIGIPVQAYDDDGHGSRRLRRACVIGNYQAGTDVLVVRHAETVRAWRWALAMPMSPASSTCSPASARTEATPYVFDTSGFTRCTSCNCTTQAEKRKFVSNIYYVRDYAVTAGRRHPDAGPLRSSISPGHAGAPGAGGAGRGHRGASGSNSASTT